MCSAVTPSSSRICRFASRSCLSVEQRAYPIKIPDVTAMPGIVTDSPRSLDKSADTLSETGCRARSPRSREWLDGVRWGFP
jgi:hypothetical protein